MGDFTEHVLFGFLSAAVVSYYLKGAIDLTAVEATASSLALVIGSVLPDIDHKNAYAHRAAKAFTSIGLAVTTIVFVPASIPLRFVIGAITFLLVYIGFSSIKMRHRGFTHTLTFGLTVTAVFSVLSLFAFLSAVPGVAAGLGIASHLVLDREFKFSA